MALHEWHRQRLDAMAAELEDAKEVTANIQDMVAGGLQEAQDRLQSLADSSSPAPQQAKRPQPKTMTGWMNNTVDIIGNT